MPDANAKLQDVIDILCGNPKFQMKAPGITTSSGGRLRTLYMSTVASIEKQTRDNLKKTLGELDLSDGSELFVADDTTPNTVTIKLSFINSSVEMQEL